MTMADATQESRRQRVYQIWAEALPNAEPEAGFFDQGGNSLSAMQLIGTIEKEFGVEVPFSLLATVEGVDELAAWLSARLGE